MFVPMEILSQMMTRTDSGSGVRQRAGPGSESGSRFEKIFENAMQESQSLITEKQDTGNDKKDVMPTPPDRPDKEETKGEELAAGVIGNPQEIVFILEGDKESATNLEPIVRIPDAEPDTEQTARPVETGEPKTEVQNTDANAAKAPEAAEQNTEVKQFAHYMNEVKTGENAVITNETQTETKQVEYVSTANTETAQKPVQENNEKQIEHDTGSKNDGVSGEVTARMPYMRTSERQEKEDNNSELSRDGDLSPLENENDKNRVKGQNSNTYSETAEAVRSTAEDKTEPVNVMNITPPPTEGLKVEQFRADQQIKQLMPEAPVKQSALFDEMISRIDEMQTESQHSMTIQLKPEFLGKVALEIAMDAAGLHVKINAEDSGIRSMINGQLNALIESLENKGIAVVEVEVVQTGVNYGKFQDPREGEQTSQQNKPRRGTREINAVDGAAYYYAALPVEVIDNYLNIDANLSTVEYSA